MKIYWISLIVLLALTGCAISQTEVAESPKLPLSSPTMEPFSTLSPAGDNPQMNPHLSTPSSSGLKGLIEEAKADLAQRLSVPISDISLEEAKAVVWPDGSIGCPKPDMAYADVLLPGYLILLNAYGQDYEYHAGKSSDIFYCEKPTPPVPGMDGDV